MSRPHWLQRLRGPATIGGSHLAVSLTNAIALSPADAMPLTRRAKMLVLFRSSASLLLLAMVAARAVNILS